MVEQQSRQQILEKRFYDSKVMGAIGDTYGMPVEGWSRFQIRKFIGELTEIVDPQELYFDVIEANNDNFRSYPEKYATRTLEKGSTTDDTCIDNATASGIIRAGGFSLRSVASKHVVMYRYESTHNKDTWDSFGRVTTAACINLSKGISPYESGVDSPYPGNAPSLKAGSIGMAAYAMGKYMQGLRFAQEVGQMTHKAEASVAGGVVQTHSVFSILDGIDKESFLESLPVVCAKFEPKKSHEENSMTQKLTWVRDNRNVDINTAYNALGSTFNATSNYPLTIFMAQKYWDDPYEGLIKTVNLGGDADSTGFMYGTLMGLRHGIFVPQDWVDTLQGKEELQELAKGLSKIT